MDTTSKTVANRFDGPSKDVSEAVRLLEFPSFFSDQLLDFADTTAESCEYGLHVTALFHGDDSGVIFFVDPDQEVFLVVVEDTSTIWPVTSHTSGGQKRGNWFVEQEVIVDELILLGISHALERVVLASKVGWKTLKGISDNSLNFTSFGT